MAATENVGAALLLTFLAGFATVIGGVIVVVFNPKKLSTLGVVLSFASGVMVYISFMDMLPEAQLVIGFGAANIYFFVGIIGFAVLTKLIPEPELPAEVLKTVKENPKGKKNSEEQSLWRAGIMTAVGISAHNVPEGIAVYIACLRGPGLGLPLALAIAAHNIPEGMAVASPILGATGSKWLALKYTLFSGLCEPAGALLVGYLFTSMLNEYVINCMLAAVAGIMILKYRLIGLSFAQLAEILICLKELIPKTLEHLSPEKATFWHVIGMAFMAASVWALHYKVGFHQHTHHGHSH